MRRTFLALAMLVAICGLAVPSAVEAAATTGPKIVLIVGATGSVTPTYRADMDAVASTAAKYSANILKIYSPNATWAAVKAAIQGANLVVYMGHGNGFPSPYNSTLMPDRVDGFGLNAAAGQGDSNTTYYGEQYIASQVRLAPNAVVLLSHLCYASGNSEPGNPEPTLSVAKQRLDNFAAGFAAAGAAAVIADGHDNPSYYVDALFSSHQPIDQLWTADPWSAKHIFSFPSVRTVGFTAMADPSNYSGGVYTGFYRSLVVKPGVTTDDFTSGSSTATYQTSAKSTFVPLDPVRLLDTRSGDGLPAALASGTPGTFQVAGLGGVPSDAVAVTGNLTVTGQTSAGYLFLGPAATGTPTSSTLNFPVGDNRANGVTVALGSGGTLSLTYVTGRTGDRTQAIFDVTGYYVPDTSGAMYVAETPVRLLDSRIGAALLGPIPSNVAQTFQVAGWDGVPSAAVAITGNLTVTAQNYAGYLFLGPAATATPTSSTLNFPVRDNRANGVTVALGSGGTLSLTYVTGRTGRTTQAILDITGYFTK